MIQDEPSEISLYAANTFHSPNTVEETIPQSPRQPKSPINILRRPTTLMVQPENNIAPAPNVWRSIQATISASCGLNVLLAFIPISWATKFALPDQHTLIYIFTFLAIIPLAKLLAFATDELSLQIGQTLADLLNATLGNAVELIVSIIALAKCQLGIVQSSLVGSILRNLFLVLGMCLFTSDLRFSEQGLGAVQPNSFLLIVSIIFVLLPSAFHVALQGSTEYYDEPSSDYAILKTSHGVSIILLFIYASYLVFRLFSHKALYDDDNEDMNNITGDQIVSSPNSTRNGKAPVNHLVASEGEVCVEPPMSLALSLCLLVIVIVLFAVTAEFLVDSIDGLTKSGPISKDFVTVVLLPIVGNAAQHVTAVTISVKDKLTLSLGVAVGSRIVSSVVQRLPWWLIVVQKIVLFVILFIVILGWIMGRSLTLLFDQPESIVMFLSVLTVTYVVQYCKSLWLEGMILMCLGVILGVTFWYYPGGSHSANSDSRRHSAY